MPSCLLSTLITCYVSQKKFPLHHMSVFINPSLTKPVQTRRIVFLSVRGRGGHNPPPPFFVFSKCSMILLWKSFYKMLFNSIFQNVATLLCITNTPTMLYAVWFGVGRGESGGLGPLFLNFLNLPEFIDLNCVLIHKHATDRGYYHFCLPGSDDFLVFSKFKLQQNISNI